MLPRRTLRETSRTAKKPANSLVNPWVSRMNSSDNQIPPQTTAATFRAALGLCFPYSRLPQGAEIPRFSRVKFLSRDPPPPAGLCRQRPRLCKAESGLDRAWPLVEGLTPTLGHKPCLHLRKAVVNDVVRGSPAILRHLLGEGRAFY